MALTAVGLVALAVVGSGLLGDSGAPPPAELTTDVATEDAVVTVLQLFAAETALPDAVRDDGDPFALPGVLARAQALTRAIAQAEATLAATRDTEVAPGTPAATYASHSDHDVLLDVARGVADHATELSVLHEVHTTLLTGASTVTPDESRQHIAQAQTSEHEQVRAWGLALQQVIDGPADPQGAEAARLAAGQDWRAEADRLAPAALQDLTAFLNGIDQGVLAALDGHPVAGPALQRLRS